MDHPPISPASEVRPAPARPLPCLDCGYDLAGLPGDGTCPECGCSIDLTLRGDPLHEADPGYLNDLREGERALRWGARATLALILFSVVTYKITYLDRTLLMGFENAIVWLNYVGARWSITVLLLVYGAWRLSTRDPSKRSRTKPDRPTLSLRIACAAILALMAGADSLLDQWTFDEFKIWLSPALWVLTLLVFFGSQVFMLNRFAMRLGSATLRRRVRHFRDYGLLALLSQLVLAGIGEMIFVWLYLRTLESLRQGLDAAAATQSATAAPPTVAPDGAGQSPRA